MYIFLTATGPLIAICSLVGCIVEHLQNRHNPTYWGAVLLPSWVYNSIPGEFLYAGLEAMIVYSNAFSAFLGAISGVMYGVLTLNWINLLINRQINCK